MRTTTKDEFNGGLLAGLDFSIDAGDVRQIIGVDAGSFQQWLARGLLKFESLKVGKRSFRKFHVSEIPRLVLISEIWKNGVLVSEAIQVADRILEKVSAHPFPSVKRMGSATAKKLAETYAPLALIFWFRQANLVYFAFEGGGSAGEIFDREGYASCIVIRVATLKSRIREAILQAKRAQEARGSAIHAS